MDGNSTSPERNRVMSRVRAVDTKPEMAIRRLLHRMGYRYRLHVSVLPGRPDIVFPARKKIVLVHGCFWHRHRCQNGRRFPKSRSQFWRRKLEGNKVRDRQNILKLRRLGYAVRIIWECQVARVCTHEGRRDLLKFLGSPLPRSRRRPVAIPMHSNSARLRPRRQPSTKPTLK